MTDKRKLKPSAPPRPLSLKQALGLGALVLLAHLWLLARTPLVLGPEAAPLAGQTTPPPSLSLSARSLEAGPPAAQAPASVAPSRSAASAASLTTRTEPAPARAPLPAAEGSPPREVAPTATAEPVPEAAAPAAAAPSSPPAQTTEPRQAPEAEPVRSAGPAAPQPQPQPVAPAEVLPTLAGPEVPRLQVPASARLLYELSGQSRGFSYSAEALMTWQQDAQRYEARLVISSRLMLGSRTMHSAGEVGSQGIAPRRFSDRSRSEQATHFQPEQGRIVFSNNAPQAAWQAGVQDRLSLFFQLGALLAGEPGRYAPGTQIQVPTAGSRDVDTWVFTVTGPSTQALPMGEQATVALRRERRREYDQSIELWFAPALGYLPVRIRITQPNGDVLDQRLASLQPL